MSHVRHLAPPLFRLFRYHRSPLPRPRITIRKRPRRSDQFAPVTPASTKAPVRARFPGIFADVRPASLPFPSPPARVERGHRQDRAWAITLGSSWTSGTTCPHGIVGPGRTTIRASSAARSEFAIPPISATCPNFDLRPPRPLSCPQPGAPAGGEDARGRSGI